MAKRHKNSLITASFHYLLKTIPNEQDPGSPIEVPFSMSEFEKIVTRISNKRALNEKDPVVIESIKSGKDLPFSGYVEVSPGLHFGNFDGAYYGQEYRNNLLGIIPADSLNLRPFNYLITRLRDGKILIGVTYHGQFGDYEGLKSCLTHLLRVGNHQVVSRALKSISGEIGDSRPTELRLTYRKQSDRPERKSVFGSSGVIAIKGSEYGDGFEEEVNRIATRVRGDVRERKRILADLVNQGELIDLDSDEIIGCTAIVRRDGRTRTVYFIGENSFATKFSLNVSIDIGSSPDREQIKAEMVRVMREKILPLLVG